jgi:hypothetical protein
MNMWSAMKLSLEKVNHGLLMIMLRCLDKGEYLGPAQMKHAELMCADDILDGILVEYLFHVPNKGTGMMDMERFQTGKDMMDMDQMKLYYDWMQWGMDEDELGDVDVQLNWRLVKESLEQVDHGLLMIILSRLDKGEYLTAEQTKDIEHMSKDELIEVMMPYFYHVPGVGVGKDMTGKGDLAVIDDEPLRLIKEAVAARAAASKDNDKGQQKQEGVGSDDGQDGVVYVGDEPEFPDKPELSITIEPYIAGQFKPFAIMIEENFRIIGIKVRIGEVLGASARQMKLFMGEKVLVDNMKLSSYGTPNGACLRLAIEDIEGDTFATSKTTKKGPK